ncbi:uncharacterized protein BX664DRAFT_323051 [Halteromyces radiatus]|uniref:uncharacterized protein n=1 Tax=Halteromyces radiatus TaxID=101107 RepID=UPI0022211CF8|nr:uncharacterized protein BX664DRAFT_323051 [Halteromyces radiatus]KAI8100167.1 hypothetical protein BX664DRAFT_323051 [Halteromyces radiatus]
MNTLAVYGGAGALGRSLVSYFKNKGFRVVSIDLVENKEADANTITDVNHSLEEQGNFVKKSLDGVLNGTQLAAIFCVAGGWAGGNAAGEGFLKSAELMIKQSVNSSLVAAHVAAHHLKAGGLLTLTGALAAVDATPGMIGYGVAKAAVHHLTKDLAQKNGGLPLDAKVIAICPVTIDTPMNRKHMPTADFTSWTSPDDIAK